MPGTYKIFNLPTKSYQTVPSSLTGSCGFALTGINFFMPSFLAPIIFNSGRGAPNATFTGPPYLSAPGLPCFRPSLIIFWPAQSCFSFLPGPNNYTWPPTPLLIKHLNFYSTPPPKKKYFYAGPQASGALTRPRSEPLYDPPRGKDSREPKDEMLHLGQLSRAQEN